MLETRNALHPTVGFNVSPVESVQNTRTQGLPEYSAALQVRVGEEDESSYECCRTY